MSCLRRARASMRGLRALCEFSQTRHKQPGFANLRTRPLSTNTNNRAHKIHHSHSDYSSNNTQHICTVHQIQTPNKRKEATMNETKTDDGSPRGKAMRQSLPEKFLAVAMKNARHRFFIPSMDNSFGGVQYDYVMVDNGSNSLLLPFPVQNAAILQQYEDGIYSWDILTSTGTDAVHSPTLVISRIDGIPVGEIVLGGRSIMDTTYLRFHLGSESAKLLVSNPRLGEDETSVLRSFLAELGDGNVSRERKYVLLGQTVLKNLYSLQAGKMFLIMKRGCLPVRDDLITTWNVIKNFEKPANFDDLVDEDHDGDWVSSFDDEDLNESFFIDEPGTV